jgi:membrane protease YdiL (CAAX protease family)
MIALEAQAAPWRTPAFLAVAVGCAVLLARPWLVRPAADPTAALVVAFVVVGVLGATVRLPAAAARSSVTTACLVALVGVAAFVVGRLIGGGVAAAPALPAYLLLNTLAAVTEEALFRRLLYGLLLPLGVGIAVVGSAAAFAAVHVTVWGAWALPVDLAAGLLLSWQRWASGRWSVPAVTHAAANVVAVL